MTSEFGSEHGDRIAVSRDASFPQSGEWKQHSAEHPFSDVCAADSSAFIGLIHSVLSDQYPYVPASILFELCDEQLDVANHRVHPECVLTQLALRSMASQCQGQLSAATISRP